MPAGHPQTPPRKPDARIIVTGCAAQIAPRKFASMPEVDLVLGNGEKAEIEKYLTGSLTEKALSATFFPMTTMTVT